MKKSLLILSLLFLLSTNALALEWVSSPTSSSCANTCIPPTAPVASGNDGSGYAFFVCRGKASNGELRPGFNIDTSSDSAGKCLYEHGGVRGESTTYDCLCN